jgi:uncharacterized protein YciI
MKRIILSLLFVSLITATGQSQEDKKLFAMIYSKGTAWNDTLSTSQQPYFGHHVQFLQQLRKDEKIVMGGRYSDLGFMILKAKDMETAQQIVAQDSSVIIDTFKAELFEFTPFYEGCIEIEK